MSKPLGSGLWRMGLTPAKQRDPADSRQKYLTEEQVVRMARKREIELHLPDPEQKGDEATRILAAMADGFATLEQHETGRFEQLTVETQTAYADLRHDLEQQLLLTLNRLKPTWLPCVVNSHTHAHQPSHRNGHLLPLPLPPPRMPPPPLTRPGLRPTHAQTEHKNQEPRNTYQAR